MRKHLLFLLVVSVGVWVIATPPNSLFMCITVHTVVVTKKKLNDMHEDITQSYFGFENYNNKRRQIKTNLNVLKSIK